MQGGEHRVDARVRTRRAGQGHGHAGGASRHAGLKTRRAGKGHGHAGVDGIAPCSRAHESRAVQRCQIFTSIDTTSSTVGKAQFSYAAHSAPICPGMLQLPLRFPPFQTISCLDLEFFCVPWGQAADPSGCSPSSLS